MAVSKGQEHGRGHSPTGAFGSGGHHRKDVHPHPMPAADHMKSAASPAPVTTNASSMPM